MTLEGIAVWENEGGAANARVSACRGRTRKVIPWIVPPIILPLGSIVLIAAYALYLAYL